MVYHLSYTTHARFFCVLNSDDMMRPIIPSLQYTLFCLSTDTVFTDEHLWFGHLTTVAVVVASRWGEMGRRMRRRWRLRSRRKIGPGGSGGGGCFEVGRDRA
ncbi:hypothetical protein R6Q59_011686 [Mikania micrantha]